jgi:thiol-disulfide isomerase/thioredoxin
MPNARSHISLIALAVLVGLFGIVLCGPALAIEILNAKPGVAAAGLLPTNAKPPTPQQSVIYMTDGDYFTGSLQDSSAGDVIGWQSDGAVRPFQFPTAAVRAAFFPSLEKPQPAQAEYCFELSDGDRIFGSLAGISPDAVEIDSARHGRLSIQRDQVRRIVPWQGATAWEYSGPSSLSDWRHLPDKDGWLEEAGHLLTEAPSASLRRSTKLPEQALVEIAVSWNKKLDFMFVLASGSDKRHESEGIHLEVWDGTLVLVRETKDDADLATICELKTSKNRIHLQLLIDQSKGTVAAHSLDGTKLGEITVKTEDDKPLEWIFVRNHRGDVRLEQLVIGKWSGQVPAQVDVTRERIQRADGSIVYGDIVRFDPEAKQFILKEGDTESLIAAADVATIAFAPTDTVPTGGIRIGCHDGSRVSGQLSKVEAGKLYLSRQGIEQPVVFPLADVRAMIGALNQSFSPPEQASVGRLEMDGVRSHGILVDGKSDESASCLVWQPRQSSTNSPLQHGVSGQIVYRDPPPPARKPSQQELQRQQQIQQRRAQQNGIFGAMVNAFSGAPPAAAAPRMSGYPHAVFLRAGDRIPCIVTRIDDRGVHFSSSVVESAMVPHDQIRALELVPRTVSATLAEEKRQRLLTLPRMQRNNPPTHLIAATSGDYFRTRLQSMDAQTVVAETRLESKRLPRGRVATIIWLHPKEGDEAQDDSTDAEPAPAPGAMRVQAVRNDGVRLTFVPQEFAKNALIGSSDLLGACNVEVKAVDRFLLGNKIDASSEESLYDAWQMTDALDPKYVTDEAASGATTAGVNSALIGKPAPEVNLDLLEGGKFKLSEEKGHIVVLDFWASWCAPCMASMPELDKITSEFKDKNVKYVAVNMQEDKATISGALERLQLNPAVALDIDGVAAERYEVSAVPQVVIVDANGNVARMFIGVDVDFAQHLREALTQMLDPAAPPADDSAGQ